MAQRRNPTGPGGSQGSGMGEQSAGKDPNQDRRLQHGDAEAQDAEQGAGAGSGRPGAQSEEKARRSGEEQA